MVSFARFAVFFACILPAILGTPLPVAKPGGVLNIGGKPGFTLHRGSKRDNEVLIKSREPGFVIGSHGGHPHKREAEASPDLAIEATIETREPGGTLNIGGKPGFTLHRGSKRDTEALIEIREPGFVIGSHGGHPHKREGKESPELDIEAIIENREPGFVIGSHEGHPHKREAETSTETVIETRGPGFVIGSHGHFKREAEAFPNPDSDALN